MASLYTRGRFYWLKYRRHGRLVRESTGYRVGVGHEKRKADELRAQRSFEEAQDSPQHRHEAWDAWVPGFLSNRSPHPVTVSRYLRCWQTVAMYLQQERILAPRNLTREHCLGYLDWRKRPDRRAGKYRAGKNTAIWELGLLRSVVKEAMARGFCLSNPCRELGVRTEPRRIKSAFDSVTLAMVDKGIDRLPAGELKEFFRNSFKIARYQGCRLAETFLNPLSDVDIFDGGGGIIRFKIKGGRTHAAPLHPALRPLFLKLKKQGRTQTYRYQRNPSKLWFNFLHKIGVKKVDATLCFHSLRVLVATELARQNVHEAKARRYIGHASTTVHRIYQRLSVADVADVVDAISAKPKKT